MLVVGTPRFQSFLSTGEFNAGGFVYSYIAGSSSTGINTYPSIADALAKTNPNTNPVVLDSEGSADIVLNGATRLVIQDSNGDLLYSFDDLDESSLDIIDANGNTLVHFVSATNAANYITISNAASGTAPSITATGGDTNANLNASGVGSGGVQINGTYVLPLADGTNGQVITTNGAAATSWTTIPTTGRINNIQVLTTTGTGTYTPTAGTTKAIVVAIGAGGGGGGGSSGAGGGGGGGAGGTCIHYITTVLTSYTYTVGAGGSGGTTSGTTGIVGANTTFGTGPIFTATGGNGGSGNNSTTGQTGGTGGIPTGANISNITGGGGDFGVYVSGSNTGGGCGGASMFGGGGGGVVNGTVGNNGGAYGSGGGGGAPSSGSGGHTGGTGAQGIIIVYEYF